MIHDAEEIEQSSVTDRVFDVCIVGSGPAGITLALALAGKGRHVGLFEAGGLQYDSQSQILYEGSSVGQDYFPLTATRLRQFGGTSGHWSGWCYHLDDIDFRPRVGTPYGDWPLEKSDLDPYREATFRTLDLEYPETITPYLNRASSDFESFLFRKSLPTRFAEKYGEELRESRNIETYFNANLVDIRLHENLEAIHHLKFRSYDRQSPFAVKARYYVLCLGGLENPRALLNANSQISGGVGNENDVVGRFFCEHPHVKVADALLDRIPRETRFFKPTASFIREHDVGNFSVQVRPAGVSLGEKQETGLRNKLKSLVCSSSLMTRLATSLRNRSIECVDGQAEITLVTEQAPNPESRVTLGEEQDIFGLRKLELNWQLSEIDFDTLRIGTLGFGSVMANQELGRIKLVDWLQDRSQDRRVSLSEISGGHHHMCTTRMGRSSNSSVVDGSCRVHSIDNLYLGGSSVFATAGWANPTYTIVQLAFRLSDHLNERLRRG